VQLHGKYRGAVADMAVSDLRLDRDDGMSAQRAVPWGMIRKSVKRFSEKIMPEQESGTNSMHEKVVHVFYAAL
jgi:hypothetical protein